MEQRFTETLKEYYQRNTQLELVRNNGDLQFSGSIVRYSLSPQAVVSSGDPNLPDRAGQMRLTISVEVDYLNLSNEEENKKLTQVMVDKVFSFSELGFQEFQTSNYLTSILAENGFEIEKQMHTTMY